MVPSAFDASGFSKAKGFRVSISLAVGALRNHPFRAWIFELDTTVEKGFNPIYFLVIMSLF